ncbi:MAG: hypothetical protein WA667_00790 [Candidatus Nitrosopolaris sp.]
MFSNGKFPAEMKMANKDTRAQIDYNYMMMKEDHHNLNHNLTSQPYCFAKRYEI